MKRVSRKNAVRLVLLFAAVGMSNNLLGGYLVRGSSQEELIDWDKVKSAFRDYLTEPVPEKAKAFLDILPFEGTKNQTGDRSTAVLYIYDNYLTFEAGVLAGDKYLTEAAFRLLNFSDAAFSEVLDEILGNLATENPRLFLEVLYEYKESWFVKQVRPPVLGTSFEDLCGDILQWKRRIKALKTVKETKYRQIRDECIRILEETIKKYQPK